METCKNKNKNLGSQTTGLKCMYTNIDSFNNKRPELEAMVTLLEPDIIGLTEINPKNVKWSLTTQDVQLHGYTLFVNLEGRGVALYVKELYRTFEVSLGSCVASTWCEMRLREQDRLLIGVIYQSPTASEEPNSQIIEMIQNAVDLKTSHLLIMGDLNLPGIDWNLQTSSGSLQERSFLNSFHDWFLWQHTTQPTHYRAQQTANILDLVITNEENNVKEINVCEPVGKSDNVFLNWTLICYTDDTRTKVNKKLYDKGDYEAMRKFLTDKDWLIPLQGNSVEDQWKNISELIYEAVGRFVPNKVYYSRGTGY